MSTNSKTTIRFLGAAGTVTGSKYLVSAYGKSILIDCGMFQGLKTLRMMNWEKLPVNVPGIDCVLLTHGHLDHTGYLPRLIKEGFKGKIIGTAPTLDIARIILEDSARIQEEDAERANTGKFTRHAPALPLYTSEDVKNTLPHFTLQALDKWLPLSDHISVRFRYNGHILGATFIELKIGNRLFVFSGDIGRENDPLMYPPEKPLHADVLLMESTYGGRLHPQHPELELAEMIHEANRQNGTIIIPSFAVERTQSIMYLLWQLRKDQKIPNLPIYLDTPMGANVLDLFERYPDWHRLSPKECQAMCDNIQMVQTMKDTLKLAAQKSPKIVIAGSGMASGGRVLTYFQTYISDPSATVLLAGYQAEGSRGRSLLEGAKEIKLYGKMYPVRARIGNIEGLSAHADQGELVRWLNKLDQAPEKIFLVHGEKTGAEGLKAKIQEAYGWKCAIPRMGDVVEISNF